MSQKTMQVCFVNTDQRPSSVKHISFYTSGSGDDICLHEIIEETYPHPDAPDEATVTRTTTRFVESHHKESEKASHIVLLEAAQTTARQITARSRSF